MKYRLTNETIKVGEVILHRIECVEAFADVKAGDKGGWIEKESNLSQENGAWVYDEARVWGKARVRDNAEVCDKAEVYGNAWVCDNAQVYGNAWVCGNAQVFGNAWVYGNAEVCEHAKVFGNAEVREHAQVYGNAEVREHAQVYGNACVYDNAEVSEHAVVRDNAAVYGRAGVKGYVYIRGNAKISQMSDYIVFKNNFSSGRYFTWTRSDNMWAVGCFHGTGEKLIEKARKDNEDKARCYALYVKLVEDLQKV